MKEGTAALLLIDMQKESGFGLSGVREAVAKAVPLLESARQSGTPVIFTRQVNRADAIGLSRDEPVDGHGHPQFYATDTPGVEIVDELAPLENELVIDKLRWSGFYKTSLHLMLQSLEVTDLYIGGLVTDGCLMTTAFDAYFRDYRIHLVHDICATTSRGAHEAAVLMMANWIYGIRIYEADEAARAIRGECHKGWKWQTPGAFDVGSDGTAKSFLQVTKSKTKSENTMEETQ